VSGRSQEVSVEAIRELRARTGAGVLECRRALVEAQGDLERAIEILRARGLAAAAQRAGRSAAQGVVDAYIHGNGVLGVLIEVNCETDFVARTEEFRRLVRDLAMQVAATDPKYISRDQIPPEELEREREIARSQLQEAMAGKPVQALERAVEGKVEKWIEGVVLLEQPFIRDEKRKVSDVIAEVVAKTGENIVVRRFCRFRVGEVS
jgi:elongation factor Ts